MSDGSPSTEQDDRIFELYTLAVELADRVSARRAGANAFFVSAQSAVVAALGFLAAQTPPPPDRYLVALSTVGIAVSFAWFLLLRSYRDLNRAKFKVIDDLEARLPYPIFREEWKVLKEDPVKWWRPSYAELGTIERLVPSLFALIHVVLAATILCS